MRRSTRLRVVMNRSLVLGIGIALLAIGFLTIIPSRSRAEVTNLDALGYVFNSRFEVDFGYTWSSTDCFQGYLYFNSILIGGAGEYCPIYTGEPFYGYIYADAHAGTYMFQLYDYALGHSIYWRNWTTPGVSMSLGLSKTSPSIGESDGVLVTMTLQPGGPDEYYSLGTLTVDAGNPISQTVGVDVYGPHYWAYYNLTPVPQESSLILTVPVTFSSSGSKTVNVSYTDPVMTKTGTMTASVVDSTPVRNLNQGLLLSEVIGFAALAIGVVSLIVGLRALRAARKGGPAMATTPSQAPPSTTLPEPPREGPPGPPG